MFDFNPIIKLDTNKDNYTYPLDSKSLLTPNKKIIEGGPKYGNGLYGIKGTFYEVSVPYQSQYRTQIVVTNLTTKEIVYSKNITKEVVDFDVTFNINMEIILVYSVPSFKTIDGKTVPTVKSYLETKFANRSFREIVCGEVGISQVKLKKYSNLTCTVLLYENSTREYNVGLNVLGVYDELNNYIQLTPPNNTINEYTYFKVNFDRPIFISAMKFKQTVVGTEYKGNYINTISFIDESSHTQICSFKCPRINDEIIIASEATFDLTGYNAEKYAFIKTPKVCCQYLGPTTAFYDNYRLIFAYVIDNTLFCNYGTDQFETRITLKTFTKPIKLKNIFINKNNQPVFIVEEQL